MTALNATHDPQRRSWIESANTSGTDFPIQNLPFALFQRPGEGPRGGVAIGEHIVDLRALAASGLLEGDALRAAEASCAPSLMALLALGRGPASALRARLSELLRIDATEADQVRTRADTLLPAMSEIELLAPVWPGAFTELARPL